MQLAVMTGIVLVTAECLDSKEDIRRVLRALTWGAAFCGVVAAIQYWGNTDISHYLKLPGFTIDSATDVIGARGGLNRVSGTAANPIELGVVCAMVLPLAIYLAIHDTGRSLRARWLPVPLIALAVPVSVSRSATIALAITMGFLIVLMPVRQRLVALAVVPIALAGSVHDGARTDRNARLVFRAGRPGLIDQSPDRQLSLRRACRAGGAVIWSRRRHPHQLTGRTS